MSVVFRPLEGSEKKYQIVITIDLLTGSPEEDLKDITQEIIRILCEAAMDGMIRNYYHVFSLLQTMLPDSNIFKSLK